MNRRIAKLLALALIATATAAGAQDRQAQVWAASCAACHGTHGNSNSAIPSIAGQDKQALLAKLKAYKNDQLSATVMHQHAKGYTDSELERLADFFSRQKR